MFCPFCGVKNDASVLKCASCKQTIPSLDAERAAPSRPRPARPAVEASNDQLGSVGDRMLALLMDRAVIIVLALMVAALLADQWNTLAPRMPSLLLSTLLGGLVLAAVVFVYHVLFEAGFGTTLGKAVMGLQVRSDGRRGRFAAVAIRNALRIIDGLALYLVGFLMATFGKRRQRLGDLIGGTVVLDMPMSNGARAAMLVLWVALVAASVWIAAAICPTCRLTIR